MYKSQDFSMFSFVELRTPIYFAADAETCQLLIDAGATVNQEDDDGYSPLHLAAAHGYLEVAELLIANGANVNAVDHQKQTPLHMAADAGQPDMCELLLNKGAELKVLDIARRSPEMLARRNEHYDVLTIISAHHEDTEDEDAPLLVFKPFAGVKHSSMPAKVSVDNDLKADDFKFDISME